MGRKPVKGEKQMEEKCMRHEGERKELMSALPAAALLSHLRSLARTLAPWGRMTSLHSISSISPRPSLLR